MGVLGQSRGAFAFFSAREPEVDGGVGNKAVSPATTFLLFFGAAPLLIFDASGLRAPVALAFGRGAMFSLSSLFLFFLGVPGFFTFPSSRNDCISHIPGRLILTSVTQLSQSISM